MIANRHVTELTWLAKPEQDQLFKLIIARSKNIFKVHLKPHKINQASLGNQTPHLHWHIIPRWNDDPCFPDSIWSATRNPEPSPELEARKAAAQAAFEGLDVLCRTKARRLLPKRRRAAGDPAPLPIARSVQAAQLKAESAPCSSRSFNVA
jgi:hypothetical protein